MGHVIADPQARLDAILPAFLTTATPSAEVGSDFITLSDLCLSEPMSAGDNAPDAQVVEGPAPVVAPWGATILPAGSRLRFLGWWTERWGYGFCRGVYFHLAVETGPLSGARVIFADIDRLIATGAVARGTMAAVLLAPADTPTDHLPALLDHRRATIRSIVVAGQSRPSR